MVIYKSLSELKNTQSDGRIIVDESDYAEDDELPNAFAIKDAVQIRPKEKFSTCYECLSELGEGKFGKVYSCREKATGLLFAAKRIKLKRETDRAKVEREVAVMTQLRHSRIAQIYDAFETPENDFVLIMEVVKGGELFDRVVDEDYILTELAVVMIICQLCEAIGYMHSKNIVHLDIKPENIMCVTKTGNRIKLIDFGLAQYYDKTTNLLFMAGTPEFVAPEVIKYEPIDFHTDMWSIGVITYILLSGISPFLGDTLGETYCAVEKGNWEFDEEAFEGITDAAKDFISNLLIMEQLKRMLPHECLSHHWIIESRAKVAKIKAGELISTRNHLSKACIISYMHNKRFKRAAWALIFISKVKKCGFMSLKTTEEPDNLNSAINKLLASSLDIGAVSLGPRQQQGNISLSASTLDLNRVNAISCEATTSKSFESTSESLHASIRWSSITFSAESNDSSDSLMKVGANFIERQKKAKKKKGNTRMDNQSTMSETNMKIAPKTDVDNKRFDKAPTNIRVGTVASMLSYFAGKIEESKELERRPSRAGRTLRDINIVTSEQETTAMRFANEYAKKVRKESTVDQVAGSEQNESNAQQDMNKVEKETIDERRNSFDQVDTHKQNGVILVKSHEHIDTGSDEAKGHKTRKSTGIMVKEPDIPEYEQSTSNSSGKGCTKSDNIEVNRMRKKSKQNSSAIKKNAESSSEFNVANIDCTNILLDKKCAKQTKSDEAMMISKKKTSDLQLNHTTKELELCKSNQKCLSIPQKKNNQPAEDQVANNQTRKPADTKINSKPHMASKTSITKKHSQVKCSKIDCTTTNAKADRKFSLNCASVMVAESLGRAKQVDDDRKNMEATDVNDKQKKSKAKESNEPMNRTNRSRYSSVTGLAISTKTREKIFVAGENSKLVNENGTKSHDENRFRLKHSTKPTTAQTHVQKKSSLPRVIHGDQSLNIFQSKDSKPDKKDLTKRRSEVPVTLILESSSRESVKANEKRKGSESDQSKVRHRFNSNESITPKMKRVTSKKMSKTFEKEQGANQVEIFQSAEDGKIDCMSLEASRFKWLKMRLESRISTIENNERYDKKHDEVKLYQNTSENANRVLKMWKELEKR